MPLFTHFVWIVQTDLYDEHVLLQDSLRKARAHKRYLRQCLLAAQWRRQEVRAELAAAREGFKTAEEERKVESCLFFLSQSWGWIA